MSPWTSFFLNSLRFLAAFIVIVVHLDWLAPNVFSWEFIHNLFIYDYRHLAILVFFVISGYVIAYTTDQKHKNARDYALSRFARIYAVIFPALCLTMLLCFIGHLINPAYYQRFGSAFSNFWVSLLNLQETWFYALTPPTNGALWSLAYESWYYVLFGIVYFAKRSIFKYLGLIFLCFCLGPKLVSMIPAWAVGVAAYYFAKYARLPRWVYALGLLLGVSAVWQLTHPLIFFPWKIETPPMEFSAAFLSDWMYAGLFAFIILCASKLGEDFTPPKIIFNVAREAAGFSFSLYVIHLPILIFMGSFTFWPKDDWRVAILFWTIALVCAWLFSLGTEHQTSRLKNWLDKILPGRRV